jgi:hypothetical protein
MQPTEGTELRTIASVSIAAFLVVLLAACGSDKKNVTVINAKDGLDLRVLPDLVRKAKNAKELEKLLNEPGQKVNNLDLDEDGKVDYIKVTEFGKDNASTSAAKKGKHGFSLSVTVGGQEQEVAVVEIETDKDGARVQTYGNRHIYGHHHYYHRRYGATDFLMWHYLTSSHRPYHSYYGYGNYPSYYRSQNTQPLQTYRKSTSSIAKSAGVKQSSSATFVGMPSPNAGKSSSFVKAPLSSPTPAQKSYQSSHPSKYSSSRSGRGGFFGRSGGSRGGK